MKTCACCGETKPTGEFNRNRKTRDGRAYYCRPCAHLKAKESRERHPEAVKARHKKYARENAEQRREYFHQYYMGNRAELLAMSKVWHQENRHSSWAANYRVRCERLGLVPHVEQFTQADLFARYGDACAYCGGPFEELDHYVPVSKGGSHTLDNVRPSCTKCNAAKKDSSPDAWVASLD